MNADAAPFDPTLDIANSQLGMLSELANMAMVVSRSYAAASIAAARAVEEILADEFWQPETGRARALAGAKDAADGFQKAARTLRLTLRLQMTVAETVRDIHAGVLRSPSIDAGERSSCGMAGSVLSQRGARPRENRSDDEAREFDWVDCELRFDRERPDRLPQGGFGGTVERLGANIGVAMDSRRWGVNAGDVECEGPGSLAPDREVYEPPRPPFRSSADLVETTSRAAAS